MKLKEKLFQDYNQDGVVREFLVSGKKGAYMKRILIRFLVTNMLSWLVYLIGNFSSNVIGGLYLGQDALAGIAAVSIFSSVMLFIGDLISSGTAIIHANALSSGQFKYANKICGSSLISSIFLAIGSFLILYFCKEKLLDFFNMSTAIYEYASYYYDVLIYSTLLMPFYYYNYYLILADGGFVFILVISSINTLCNCVLSIILVRIYGSMGLGLSSTISLGFTVLLTFIHYFQKSNTIKIQPYFSIKIFLKAARMSIDVSATALGTFCLSLFIDYILSSVFGSVYLCLSPVILFAVYFGTTSLAISDGLRDYLSVSNGEKNGLDIRNATSYSFRVFLFFVIFSTFLFSAFCWLWGSVFGITSPELLVICRNLSLMSSCFFIFISLLFFISGYYSALEISLPPFIGLIFGMLIFPCSFIVLFSLSKNIYLTFLGFFISFPLAVLIQIVYCKIRYKTLFYNPYRNRNQYVIDGNLDTPSIIKIRDQISEILNINNLDNITINKAMVLVEDSMLLSLERKKKTKNTIYNSHVYIDIMKEKLKIVVKDNNLIYNNLDLDGELKDFRSYAVKCISMSLNVSHYAVLATNSNTFIFDI